MQKSSFLVGLINSDKKNISEFLATWDDLNVFVKSIGKSFDFLSKLWKTNKEIEEENLNSFKEKVDDYLRQGTVKTKAELFKRFQEIFEIKIEKISSQKQLDEIANEIESQAVIFQKEFTKSDNKLKTFVGASFVDLRKHFLETMINQFKELDNEKQKKVLEEMVNKLNNLSAAELKEFKEKMKIDDISKESIKKIILGGAAYSAVAGTVGLVGFPAYIFLTSFIGGLSSFIGITLPFGFYTGATSMMAFLSSWFLPIVLAGGWLFSRKYTKKLRKVFTVASMVSISFQSYKDIDLNIMDEFIIEYNKQINS